MSFFLIYKKILRKIKIYAYYLVSSFAYLIINLESFYISVTNSFFL